MIDDWCSRLRSVFLTSLYIHTRHEGRTSESMQGITSVSSQFQIDPTLSTSRELEIWVFGFGKEHKISMYASRMKPSTRVLAYHVRQRNARLNKAEFWKWICGISIHIFIIFYPICSSFECGRILRLLFIFQLIFLHFNQIEAIKIFHRFFFDWFYCWK